MGVDQPFTPTDERYALSHAYVPEHIPVLMTGISRASPFLIEDYLGFSKDNWLVFVGYPLGSHFDTDRCNDLIKRCLEIYHPEHLLFIGPQIPPQLARDCQVRQSDEYLLLHLERLTVKPRLRREIDQAGKTLTIEHSRQFTSEHRSLVDELMRREKVPPMIEELYRCMPDYLSHSETALVLNARDQRNRLSAFFVLESAAETFDTYLLGCHSKINYVPHASDLLFAEMIALTSRRAKSKINLGLGVNTGIARFKRKWGGIPFLKYEFCQCYYGPPHPLSVLDQLLGEIF